MINTGRIISGFDAELLLGRGWFLTAFRALNENGLLLPGGLPEPFPPDAEVVVDDVEIIFEPEGRDLRLNITIILEPEGQNLPLTVFLSLDISDDGSQLIITSNLPNSQPTSISFNAIRGLAGPPKLKKLSGDDEHEPVIAFLVNLDLRASSQSVEPLPEGEHLPRGQELAISFLPKGKDMAFGIGSATFERVANDIWHSNLRADDGSHPFPDACEKEGDWKSVKVSPQTNRIRITLKAEVPIDLWPDAEVTIQIDLSPAIKDGNVSFDFEVDTNVDTGLLGDLFAFLIGGVVGFILGALVGPLVVGGIIGGAVGGIGGVITLEVLEAVRSGEVRRRVVASLEGEDIQPVLTCEENVVVEAIPSGGGGSLVEAFINAVPQSIPVGSDRPEAIFERTLLV